MYSKSDSIKILLIGVKNIPEDILLSAINTMDYGLSIISVKVTRCTNNMFGKVIVMQVETYCKTMADAKQIIVDKITKCFENTKISHVNANQLYM